MQKWILKYSHWLYALNPEISTSIHHKTSYNISENYLCKSSPFICINIEKCFKSNSQVYTTSVKLWKAISLSIKHFSGIWMTQHRFFLEPNENPNSPSVSVAIYKIVILFYLKNKASFQDSENIHNELNESFRRQSARLFLVKQKPCRVYKGE